MIESLRASDRVVSGTIGKISSTRWNQDSGEYWEDMSRDGTTRYTALPYYVITLIKIDDMVNRPAQIVDFVNIAVLGASPLDSGRANPVFHVGDELIALIRTTDLEWRSGRRRINQFVGAPDSSYLFLAADGNIYRGGYRDSFGKRERGINPEELEQFVKDVRAD